MSKLNVCENLDTVSVLAQSYAQAHAAAAAADEHKRDIGAQLLEAWPAGEKAIECDACKVSRVDASADKLAPDAAAAIELCSAGRLALLAFVAEHRLSDGERVALRRIADSLEVPHKVVKGRAASLRVTR